MGPLEEIGLLFYLAICALSAYFTGQFGYGIGGHGGELLLGTLGFFAPLALIPLMEKAEIDLPDPGMMGLIIVVGGLGVAFLAMIVLNWGVR